MILTSSNVGWWVVVMLVSTSFNGLLWISISVIPVTLLQFRLDRCSWLDVKWRENIHPFTVLFEFSCLTCKLRYSSDCACPWSIYFSDSVGIRISRYIRSSSSETNTCRTWPNRDFPEIIFINLDPARDLDFSNSLLLIQTIFHEDCTTVWSFTIDLYLLVLRFLIPEEISQYCCVEWSDSFIFSHFWLKK